MFEPIRPAPTPWQVAEGTLPPHDIEIFAADSQVIARWEGELLDELGPESRTRVREDFVRIVKAINADARHAKALQPQYNRVCKVCDAGVGQDCVMTSDHSSDPNLEPDERLRGFKKGDVRPISHFYR